jgi:hypothetical protein
VVNAIPTRSPAGKRPHRRETIPDTVRTGTIICPVPLITTDVRTGGRLGRTRIRTPNKTRAISNKKRTPFDTTEPPLPPAIDGVGMQTVINDPIALLQAQIQQQAADGDEFEGTVLNIASQASVTFKTQPT